MNEKWHRENEMGDNPSLEARIAWHLEHVKNCGCQPIPGSIRAEIRKRKRKQLVEA